MHTEELERYHTVFLEHTKRKSNRKFHVAKGGIVCVKYAKNKLGQRLHAERLVEENRRIRQRQRALVRYPSPEPA